MIRTTPEQFSFGFSHFKLSIGITIKHDIPPGMSKYHYLIIICIIQVLCFLLVVVLSGSFWRSVPVIADIICISRRTDVRTGCESCGTGYRYSETKLGVWSHLKTIQLDQSCCYFFFFFFISTALVILSQATITPTCCHDLGSNPNR